VTVTANPHADPFGDPGPVVVLRSGAQTRPVSWGRPWQTGTAAYWTALTALDGIAGGGPGRHRLGATLAEETAACILGGFGQPYETGLAAFHAVRDAGMLDGAPSADRIRAVLLQPLPVGGTLRRYRFPAQRAARLAGALAFLQNCEPPRDARELRDWLTGAPGIGPKTASWIVRNQLGSDDIAVLDVHVVRAGAAAGVFDPSWTPAGHYALLEGMFLGWAAAGGVSAADLDAVIWREQAAAARAPRHARSA
jgi:N-glycosylase/DNA lyase